MPYRRRPPLFPTLLERYVKTGKLRLELRLLERFQPDALSPQPFMERIEEELAR